MVAVTLSQATGLLLVKRAPIFSRTFTAAFNFVSEENRRLGLGKELINLASNEGSIALFVDTKTNNLAALQDTVGDRGIQVQGSITDVLTEEWQNKAFDTICEFMDNENRFEYVDKNYNWAITQSWYNRAEYQFLLNHNTYWVFAFLNNADANY